MTEQTRTEHAVVVVGGGYAGVMAANRLTRRDDVSVTLINPRPRFVDRVRLHQRATGSHDATADYGKILSGRVQLRVATVDRIDAAARTVALTSGDTVNYDYLIYAVGSGSTTPGVPGAAEFAYPIASIEDVDRLRPRLAEQTEVTVVGAGPSGIEVAAELAETGHTVSLVCGDELGPYLHPKGRNAVAKRLAALGVRMVDGTVTSVSHDAVWLADGSELRSAVTIWTAGFGVPDLATRSGLTTDAVGRLRTDETLTSVDDPRIVAAGDAGAPSDLPFRMSCQAAMQLGPQAAQTVLSRIAGEQPALVDAGFYGQCISLGRRVGIYQFAHRDDTAKGTTLRGRTAGIVKEFVCRGIQWQLAFEARRPGVLNLRAKDPSRRERLPQGVGPAR